MGLSGEEERRTTRVHGQHSPLSLLCITMILRVRRKFFEITTFPNKKGLELYWTTIFGHRNGSGGYRMYTRVPGVTGTPRGLNGPHGPKVGKRRGGQGRPRTPSPSSPNWTRRGAAPPFLLLLSSFPPSLNPTRKGGIPTPTGSRTPSLFLVGLGEEREGEREEERKGGAPPPSLSNSDWGEGGEIGRASCRERV